MNSTASKLVNQLLDIKAIKLQPENPFSWASGWKSPIYCDNRKTLSYPHVRNFIKQEFAQLLKQKYPNAEVIAGVATGAIAIGALVADELDMPFIYVRPKPKGHGLENLVEGNLEANSKVVIIEDLISTGGSSLKAVDAVRKADCEVLGMLAIFTYNFPISVENFSTSKCELFTLANYDFLIEHALEKNYIDQDVIATLKDWRKSPDTWNQ